MALGWRSQYFRYREFFLNIVDLYKKRQDLRMFLEIILSLSTVIIFLLFALKPTALTIINLIKDINEKKATIAKLDEKLRNLDRAQNNFFELSAGIQIIESSVPISPEPDGLVNQIQGVASRDSVNVLGVSIGEVALIGKVVDRNKKGEKSTFPTEAEEMPISISASGNYQNLMTFIKDIENLRRPIKVDVLGINLTETDSGRVIVAIITGKGAYLGEE